MATAGDDTSFWAWLFGAGGMGFITVAGWISTRHDSLVKKMDALAVELRRGDADLWHNFAVVEALAAKHREEIAGKMATREDMSEFRKELSDFRKEVKDGEARLIVEIRNATSNPRGR